MFQVVMWVLLKTHTFFYYNIISCIRRITALSSMPWISWASTDLKHIASLLTDATLYIFSCDLHIQKQNLHMLPSSDRNLKVLYITGIKG